MILQKKGCVILIILPIIAGLVGCVQEIVRTVEVTRVVQETVIATRFHWTSLTSTPEPPYTPILRTCQPDNCLPYFVGVEIIQEYYAFINQGLYENAYRLLSKSYQDQQSLEDFIISVESSLQTVNVITIEPYYSSNPDTEIQYYLEYYHESENKFDSGTDEMYLTVIFEDVAWKIDGFEPMTNY